MYRLSALLEGWLSNRDAVERRLKVPLLVFEALGPGHTNTWERTGRLTTGPYTPGSDPELFFVEKRRDTQNPFTMGVTLGRLDTNDIPIDDASVSRFHAWLRFDEPHARWVLTDAQSKNGTFIDTLRLPQGEAHPLADGDVIRLGDAYLRFLLPESVLQRLQLAAG